MKKGRFFILIGLVMAVAVAAIPWGVDVAQAGPGDGTYYANSPAGFRTSPSGTFWTGTAIYSCINKATLI